MNVAVIGYGLAGRFSTSFLLEKSIKNIDVYISDNNKLLNNNIQYSSSGLYGSSKLWGGMIFFDRHYFSDLETFRIIDLLQKMVGYSGVLHNNKKGWSIQFHKKQTILVDFKNVKIETENVISIKHLNKKNIVQTLKGGKEYDLVILCTGCQQSYHFDENHNSLLLNQAKLELLTDKVMTITTTNGLPDCDPGDYFILNENENIVSSNFVLRNRGYDLNQYSKLIDIVHYANRVNRKIPSFNQIKYISNVIYKKITGDDSLMVLKTIVDKEVPIVKNIQHPRISDNGKSYLASLNQKFYPNMLALHSDLRQPDSLIKKLDSFNIISDQYSDAEEIFQSGVVGYRIGKVFSKMNKIL